MKWEQYRLELLEQCEEKGEIRGIKKTMKMCIRTLFKRLLSAGIDKDQAFNYVCEDYPEYTRKEIRKILSI